MVSLNDKDRSIQNFSEILRSFENFFRCSWQPCAISTESRTAHS